jgi:hypothetical protein
MAVQTLSACYADIKANPGKFYVYILSRPDGTPFYVGCGRGVRIKGHRKESRTPAKSPKLDIIRSIEAEGDYVRYQIDSWHDTTDAAVEREIELIYQIGRSDQGYGPLTNLTDGGHGVANVRQEVRDSLSERMRRRWASPEERRRLCESMRIEYSDDRRALARKRMEQVVHPANRAKWADPDWSGRQRERRTREGNSPAARKKIGEATRLAFENPEYRQLRGDRSSRRQSTEEARKKRGELSKRMWADPEFRERMLKLRQEVANQRTSLIATAKQLTNLIIGHVPNGRDDLKYLRSHVDHLRSVVDALRSLGRCPAE